MEQKTKEAVGDMETKKLYYSQCYDTSFTSTVLECTQVKNKYQTVLAETLFYPEGGGQPADRGILDGIEVLDVREKNGVVYHITESPIPVGKQVEGRIDWAYRYDLMCQHTAEHIVSGIAHEKWGYENVGFHMNHEITTLDFNGKLSPEQILWLEEQANQQAAYNREVAVYYPDQDTLSSMHYRSKKALEGDVRIVEVPGADVCACCGIHVARTGEVGLIKLLSAQSYKGGVRITMVAGRRALADYREKCENIQRISKALSAPAEGCADAVDALKAERDALRFKAVELGRALFRGKLAGLQEGAEKAVFFQPAMDSKELRHYMNMALAYGPAYAAVFSGDDEKGYSFVIGSQTQDVRLLAGKLQEAFGCKAGGTKEFVQGKVQAAAKEIEGIL